MAMQYRIGLPADYDMAIIRRRIAERGHLTDTLDGLAFKAYLHANSDPTRVGSQSAYAPFYLWRKPEGMSAFLSGPGFAGVVASFGRPVVNLWSVWQAEWNDDLSLVTHATQETATISPHASLEDVRRTEHALAQAARDEGAEAVVSAFDPTRWTLMRFALWRSAKRVDGMLLGDAYAVGHLSQPPYV